MKRDASGYKLAVDKNNYDKAVKQYKKWNRYGRPLDFLALEFLDSSNQWNWFDALDRIAMGE